MRAPIPSTFKTGSRTPSRLAEARLSDDPFDGPSDGAQQSGK